MTDTTGKANDPYALQPDFSQTTVLIPPPLEVAPEAQPEQPAIGWMLLREVVETIVLSLVIFLLIRQVVQNYRIESHSMEPNFYQDQFILVNKLAYKLGTPTRGEVIVFHNPNNTDEDYIKRVMGLPGDTLEVRDQRVYINGQVLEEPFNKNPFLQGDIFGPQIVPPDHLFVMGDNRSNSQDSRRIGPIDESLIVGKAWLRVWPPQNFGLIQQYELEPGAPLSVAPLAPECCRDKGNFNDATTKQSENTD
ncbi:MAG: signal peptidase I [Chloroflexota bacterium]|nr:signal peptidase I [Chloroflexota bacterium]